MRIALTLLCPLLLLILAGCGEHSPLAETVSPTGSPTSGGEDLDREFNQMRGYPGGDYGYGDGGYYRYPGGSLRPRDSDTFGTGDSLFDTYSPRREFYGDDYRLEDYRLRTDDPFVRENRVDPDEELSDQQKRRLEPYRSPPWPDSPDPSIENDPYRTEDDFLREYR